MSYYKIETPEWSKIGDTTGVRLYQNDEGLVCVNKHMAISHITRPGMSTDVVRTEYMAHRMLLLALEHLHEHPIHYMIQRQLWPDARHLARYANPDAIRMGAMMYEIFGSRYQIDWHQDHCTLFDYRNPTKIVHIRLGHETVVTHHDITIGSDVQYKQIKYLFDTCVAKHNQQTNVSELFDDIDSKNIMHDFVDQVRPTFTQGSHFIHAEDIIQYCGEPATGLHSAVDFYMVLMTGTSKKCQQCREWMADAYDTTLKIDNIGCELVNVQQNLWVANNTIKQLQRVKTYTAKPMILRV